MCRFVVKVKEIHVCGLIKALYGLKQAPRAWYIKIVRIIKHRAS